jgi:trimeric autotransporter adhesin
MIQYISLLSLFAVAIYVLNDTTWKRVVAATAAQQCTNSDSGYFVKNLHDKASSVRASVSASVRRGTSQSSALILAAVAVAAAGAGRRKSSISTSGVAAATSAVTSATTPTASPVAAATATAATTAGAYAEVLAAAAAAAAAAAVAATGASSAASSSSVPRKASVSNTSSISAWLAARFGKRQRAVAATSDAADCESGFPDNCNNSGVSSGSSSHSTMLVAQFDGQLSQQNKRKMDALEERTREESAESYMLMMTCSSSTASSYTRP